MLVAECTDGAGTFHDGERHLVRKPCIALRLGGYGVPITIVNFQVFKTAEGSRLLIREVAEEHTRAPSREGRRYSVEAIRRRAREEGVEAPFERFLDMAQGAGLGVRPHPLAVAIAPPTNRTRYLMYSRPDAGGIVLSAGPAQFAEFFPFLTEEEVTAAIGPYEPEGAPHLAGAELDARLDQARGISAVVAPPGQDGDAE